MLGDADGCIFGCRGLTVVSGQTEAGQLMPATHLNSAGLKGLASH